MDGEAEEYELALRARDGDREALAALVERTRLRLFALAYAELRHYEDAQDAVAAALLQICLHVQELREPQRVRQWMQSIVRNEARRLRRGSGTALAVPADPEGMAAVAGPSLLRLDIQRALCRLPWDQARALRLYYLADLSTPEIARQMDSPEGTVRSWLHRGRQLLANESVTSLREATLQQASPRAGPAKDRQLTPAGQRVILLSYAEACQLGNDYLGTEHLLLGLLREGEGIAWKVLTQHGDTLDRVRQEVQAVQAG